MYTYVSNNPFITLLLVVFNGYFVWWIYLFKSLRNAYVQYLVFFLVPFMFLWMPHVMVIRVKCGISQFAMFGSHGFYWLVIACGSKPITRNQTYYFGKGLQVFFPKITFRWKWICEWFFWITYSKKYLNFPQCITFFC